jgi:hypothetical protein
LEFLVNKVLINIINNILKGANIYINLISL